MTQIKPLQVKNHLAGHQNKKPQLSKTVRLMSGETILVADPKATRALVALMDMNAVLGGAASHYGGPAALADMMSALHGIIFHESEKQNKNWYDLFHVINDAGHCENGLYALKANYGMAGLAQKNKLAPFVVLISDNNTKLTGRIDIDSFSMAPTFKSLEALGWNVIFVENGNDLQKCTEAIEKAKQMAEQNPTKPVAVWAKTIKGIGTKKTAESASGGHGFPCKSPTELADFIKEIHADEIAPDLFHSWIEELLQLEKKIKATAVPDTGEKIQTGISKAMIAAAKKGYPILSVTSDLPGSTGVAGFRKDFADHCLDVGVAESNMISAAAGLSKQGFIPVVDTFAQFGVTKGALPITMASLSEAPVIGVFSHTGFQDAADGASHQALSYMSMLATIPHVDLYSLSCSEEAEALMTEVIEKFVQARAL